MTPLSDKHIAPCPQCFRPSRDCEGHSPGQWDGSEARARAEAEALRQQRLRTRGTPEWRQANRTKRQALKSKPARI